MRKFEEYVYKFFVEGVRGIEEADDTYLVSLMLFFHDDDIRLTDFFFAYNTNENVAKNAKGNSSENESRWNYAFWKHSDHGLCHTNEYIVKDKCLRMRNEWVQEMGLPPVSEEYTGQQKEKILNESILMCARLIGRIHDEGVIVEKFGRSIPAFICITNDSPENQELINEQVEKNNPAEVGAYIRAWMFDVW